jgi:hypothetical protein
MVSRVQESPMKLDYAAVERCLWPQGSDRDVWMIVDSARDRRIFSDLVNSYLESTCLYSGKIPDELERAAPHLVQLVHEDRQTRELLHLAWGKSWGVFLRCGTTMERLRRHLRGFLRVNDWKGQALLFRYYDPRVLSAYLPTCNADEVSAVFGPITHFWTETDCGQLREFKFSRRGLLLSDHVVLDTDT